MVWLRQPVAACKLAGVALALLCVHHAAAGTMGGSVVWGGGGIGELQHRVELFHEQLRELSGVRAPPTHMYSLWAGLASHLLLLNRLQPDGGTRVPQAVQAFSNALAFAQAVGSPAAGVSVLNNMGALLIDAGQPLQALQALEQGLELAMSNMHLRLPRSSLLFNRAKALGIAGQLPEAQTAYTAAAVYAYGRDLPSFAKAVAAMDTHPPGLLSKVLEVLYFLGHDITSNATRPPCCYPHHLLPLAQHTGACPAVISTSHAPEPTPTRAGALLHTGMAPGSHSCAPPPPAAGSRRRNSSAVAHRNPSSSTRSSSLQALNMPTAWLAKDQDRDNNTLAWLGFAAYKALDHQGQHAAAWRALQLANTLQASSSSMHYTPEPDLHNLHTIMGSFDRPFPALGRGHPSRAPIFIVGLPRSGSTLLESLLAAHSEVVAAGEDTAFAPLSGEITQVLVGMQQHLGGAAAQQQGSATYSWLRKARQQLAGIGKKYMDRMCAAHVQPAGRSCSGSWVVDKMLHNLWLVGHIHLVLPQACIIHVARHPLDAGLSCYAQPFMSPSMSWSCGLQHIALQVNMTWQLADHWQRTLPGRVQQVLYEELVSYPEPTLRRVLSACGLPWQDQLLNSFHTRQRAVATASMSQVRQPLYCSSVGRWRQYRSQLEDLRAGLGGTLQHYEARLAAAMAAHSPEEQALNRCPKTSWQ